MNCHDEAIEQNRKAWNHSVEEGDRWTVPVSDEVIRAARAGDWSIILTPTIPVPRPWFGTLEGKKVLALASGGGQQGPVLAAAGAKVTVFDLSENQLAQDRLVAERCGLDIRCVRGRSDDLSAFEDDAFDLIVNPVSSCFFPKLRPVWRECARVLKRQGHLMTGFMNPVFYCFDFEKANLGHFEVKYGLPYSDLTSLSEDEKTRFLHDSTPREFSHTWTEQLGGLIEAGFVIDGFYEDKWHDNQPIDKFFPVFVAVRATLR